eukprot:TRINITY_DN3605_c2_g1_i4.p1 TRINITY_DN3605_c2_g1~~TRINITY_DN3605_c2_g1_i4.p1  ORF type:complete len:232 (+),score=-14.61 TRINITY_DN3605_c2_g1_i4:843-1538(+)
MFMHELLNQHELQTRPIQELLGANVEKNFYFRQKWPQHVHMRQGRSQKLLKEGVPSFRKGGFESIYYLEKHQERPCLLSRYSSEDFLVLVENKKTDHWYFCSQHRSINLFRQVATLQLCKNKQIYIMLLQGSRARLKQTLPMTSPNHNNSTKDKPRFLFDRPCTKFNLSKIVLQQGTFLFSTKTVQPGSCYPGSYYTIIKYIASFIAVPLKDKKANHIKPRKDSINSLPQH